MINAEARRDEANQLQPPNAALPGPLSGLCAPQPECRTGVPHKQPTTRHLPHLLEDDCITAPIEVHFI
jgi:hypothetical protein